MINFCILSQMIFSSRLCKIRIIFCFTCNISNKSYITSRKYFFTDKWFKNTFLRYDKEINKNKIDVTRVLFVKLKIYIFTKFYVTIIGLGITTKLSTIKSFCKLKSSLVIISFALYIPQTYFFKFLQIYLYDQSKK